MLEYVIRGIKAPPFHQPVVEVDEPREERKKTRKEERNGGMIDGRAIKGKNKARNLTPSSDLK